MRIVVRVALLSLLAGCSSNSQRSGAGVDSGIDWGPDGGTPTNGGADAGTQGLPRCQVPGVAIVTDIDATLTTSDNEFLSQLITGTHDPAERAGAAAMISDYAERGYFILYLTARPEGAPVGLTGQNAADATLEWLTAHGYPIDPEHTRVTLAPGLVFGNSAADFKSGALMDMEAEGFSFAYAYGNATSDIDAYAAAGIAVDDTFIIGPEAGTGGTVAVAGEDWLEHTSTFVDPLPAICSWQ